jgi:beta-galactosidase
MKEGTDFSAEQKLVGELNDLAHQLDPTRLTVAATHKQNVDHPVNWIPDATAFNRYYGWYQGAPSDWAKELDNLHAKFPDRRIGISEYGAGASIHQHEATPTKPKTGGPWHSEQWQSICHEQAWIAMKSRRWLWGTFVWNMFDFAADERNEGDQPGRNDKGLVTYDRRTKKDAFYFYQASWNADTPVIHITSKRFNPRPAGPAEIKVYSNCDTVELFLNGRSLGTSSGAHGVFVWSGVKLMAGKNEVRAEGRKGVREYTDSHTWTAALTATTRLTRPQTARE